MALELLFDWAEQPVEVYASGPNNNLWFSEATNTSGVRTMTVNGVVLASYGLGTIQHKNPQGITSGPGGCLWFTEEFAGTNGAIGAITTS